MARKLNKRWLRNRMLLAVVPVAERERRKNKRGQGKKVKGMKVTFRKRKARAKAQKQWKVNKKADIPVYVKKYLEDVKNPATTGDIYNYGLENGVFWGLYP